MFVCTCIGAALVLICFSVTIILYKILKKIDTLTTVVSNAYKSVDDAFSDNGLNNDYIQKSLDYLDENGYEPTLNVDDNGHQWLAAKLSENNSVNLLRIDKETFGKKANFDDIKKTLENFVNVVIPNMKKEIENAKN